MLFRSSGMTGRFDPDFYHSFKTVIEKMIDKKSQWNLSDFDNCVSVKVLFTAGRAITQSRYDKVMHFGEHVRYLQKIRNDEMYIRFIPYLNDIGKYLQKDHFILLTLHKWRLYALIVMLLRIRNVLDYFTSIG